MTADRRSGQPMVIGMVALMVLIVTLIFSFPFLVSDDWPVGLLIAAAGIFVVAFMLYLGARRELEMERRYGHGWLFNRKNMTLGFMFLVAGIVMIVLGGPLTSVVLVSAFILALGIAFVLAGIIWIVLGVRG